MIKMGPPVLGVTRDLSVLHVFLLPVALLLFLSCFLFMSMLFLRLAPSPMIELASLQPRLTSPSTLGVIATVSVNPSPVTTYTTLTPPPPLSTAVVCSLPWSPLNLSSSHLRLPPNKKGVTWSYLHVTSRTRVTKCPLPDVFLDCASPGVDAMSGQPNFLRVLTYFLVRSSHEFRIILLA
jgi:hypothetical protein